MTTITSITDNAASGVVGAVGELPDPAYNDVCSARPATPGDAGQRWRGPDAVRYDQFRTVDPQAARQFFAGAYTPGWRIIGPTSRLSVFHRRCEAGLLTVDEVSVQGRVALDISASDTVVVIQPRSGSLSVAGGRFATVDFPVLVAPGLPCALECNGARFDVVSLAAEVLRKVAADWHFPLPRQAHFLNWRPRSRATVRAWHRALDYATSALASGDTTQQPLIVAGMAPLLAGALLECYPSTVTEQQSTGEPALPELLKDAVSFIHGHPTAEVGINDVAAAVHLTPRAVQYLFRRQLGTTPTEYMRRVRLCRAHQELIAGSTYNTSVTEIAQRWGFAHTGRFAVLYRQTYGQSPHTTLRQTTTWS
jgi:AraC-like DNA-binding protein